MNLRESIIEIMCKAQYSGVANEFVADKIMTAFGSVKVVPLEKFEHGLLLRNKDGLITYRAIPTNDGNGTYYRITCNNKLIGSLKFLKDAQDFCQQHFKQIIMGSLVVGDKL